MNNSIKDYKKATKLMSKYVNIETMLNHANEAQAEIINKVNNRTANNAVQSVKVFCDTLIKKRLQKIANALPDEGYSMGSVVNVWFNKICGQDDRTEEYDGNDWTAKHGRVDLDLTLEELRNIKVIGGLVTYISKQRAKVKKCYWYSCTGAKQHFELFKVDGFIYGDYHSTNKDEAKERGQIKIDRIKRKKVNERKYKAACRKQYSYQDSIDAGNCKSGTRAFIMRLGLDSTKKYRGNFLLKKAAEKSTSSVRFIKQMIEFKM